MKDDLEYVRKQILQKTADAARLYRETVENLAHARRLYAEAQQLADENGLVFRYHAENNIDDLHMFMRTNVNADWESSETGWQSSSVGC